MKAIWKVLPPGSRYAIEIAPRNPRPRRRPRWASAYVKQKLLDATNYSMRLLRKSLRMPRRVANKGL